MGWLAEGSDHEGYVVCVFADGRYGSGSKRNQVQLLTPEGLAIYDTEGPDSVQYRPPSQVVGWKVACTCLPFRQYVVLDPLWTRVWDPAEQDYSNRRIYAGDPSSDDPIHVGYREDLEQLFIQRWEQHIAPDLFLHAIRTLGEDLLEIESKLDKAVIAARAEGISWDKIGRAVGITRQGARKRWDRRTSAGPE